MTLPIIESCNGCGACCQQVNVPPFWDYALERVPQWAVDEIRAHQDSRAYNGGREQPCLWYNIASGQCNRYEIRPAVCREYEIGGKHCLAAREEQGIKNA